MIDPSANLELTSLTINNSNKMTDKNYHRTHLGYGRIFACVINKVTIIFKNCKFKNSFV